MIMSIGSSGQKITADSIKMKLLQDVKFDSASSNTALMSKKGNFSNMQKKMKSKFDRKGKSRCFNCDGVGHFASECPSKSKDRNLKSPKGCSMFATYHAEAKNYEWCFDSGATDHMTSDSRYFKELKPFKGQIKTANSMTMNAVNKGDISLDVLTPKGKQTVAVHDVLYVPEIEVNLLSIKKIVDHENFVIFDKNGCRVMNSSKEVIATGRSSNGLYKLDIATNQNAYVSQCNLGNIWHRRFGHLGQDNMKLLAQGLVKGVDLSQESLSNCISCAEGKQHRNKFPSEGSRSSKVLDLIHSDICGPMEVKSIKGSIYFVTFIDDFTRKVFVYFMKTKDSVLMYVAVFVNSKPK